MRKRERRESSQVPSKNGPSDSRQCQNRKPEREKKNQIKQMRGSEKRESQIRVLTLEYNSMTINFQTLLENMIRYKGRKT